MDRQFEFEFLWIQIHLGAKWTEAGYLLNVQPTLSSMCVLQTGQTFTLI
jgi:hypothetical protein